MSQVAAIAADMKGDMGGDEQTPLHLYLRDNGHVLATRGRGKQAAAHVREIADDDGDLILDFDEVEVASPPYLQEIVDTVHALLLRAKDTGRIVLFANMNDDVAETMRYVVARQKLSLAYQEGDHITLLEGKPHLVHTLETAQKLKSFTAPQLAEKLDIENDTATQRLKRLMETGAVVREPDPETRQGIRHLYRTATPALARGSMPARPSRARGSR
jgi:DNA-binding MarR family transcriptional regulator